MGSDISGLHHVGLVVDNMGEALATFRRLGFALAVPTYPTMAPHEGAEPEPFGAANTHADFHRNFVELATFVKPGEAHKVPAEAKTVPLQVPAEILPAVLQQITSTSERLAVYLDRFEGAHILIFSAPDVEAVAARLSTAGVGHGGVHTVQRPVETASGPRAETVSVLELVDTQIPEGRVGMAGDLDPDIQATRVLGHPNGAVELVEVLLCAAEADLDAVQARYETYLDRSASPDRVFDLNGARVALLSPTELDALLPGERAPGPTAIAAYTVAVDNLDHTTEFLRGNEIPHRASTRGELFVPAESALGAAIIFRQR